MDMPRLIALILLALTSVHAQTVQPASRVYNYSATYQALKEALGLSDAQVQQFSELQRSRQTANQAVYRQITEKQNQMNKMLEAGSADAYTLGQLQIEMANLRKQVASTAPIRDQALAILDAAQRANLANLESALKLQQAAEQAVGMGLIEQPARGTPGFEFLSN